MPRIQPLSPPYADDVQQTFERLMPPGIDPLRLFRTVAHNPRVLQRMHRGGLLDPGSITVRQRELAILRTCAVNHADYEWSVHVAIFAAQAGFDDELAHLTTRDDPESERWSEDERSILRLVDALHHTSTVDDALFEELARHFSKAQIIELVMLVGLYHAVSFVVNVTGVEHEPWTPPVPPP